MLADAANIAHDLMSNYCTINPKFNAPRLRPPLHAVMKIIAVLGVTPEEANEALELAGYSIKRDDSIRHFRYYQDIVDNPDCKPRDNRNIDDLTARLNSLLNQAAKGEKGYRGTPEINDVFIRL